MAPFPDAVLTADTVIISGPPMTGEYPLFHKLLAQRGDHRIVISTGTPADELREDHNSFVGETVTLRVVDCISAGRGETQTNDAHTKYVDAPGNLTSIGVKITEFLESLPEGDEHAVVGLHSISQLLMHAGQEQTYQFIHILAQQTATAGVPLIATINAQAHDEQTTTAITTRFDCILETRTANGRNEFRARTAKTEPSAWLALSSVTS